MNSPQTSGKPKFKREPANDAVWIFQISYIGRIDLETFVPKFCYLFEDYLEWSKKDFTLEDLEIFPLAIFGHCSYPDPNSRDTRYLASQTFGHLRKEEDQTKDQKKKDKEWSIKLRELTDLATESCSRKPWGSIVFKVYNPPFNLMKKIEQFLIELDYYHDIGTLESTTHYPLGETDKRVTVFEYDCEVVD